MMDLSGHAFGRLKAITHLPPAPKSRQIRWLCKCSCGAETIVRSQDLRSGRVVSCGCAKRDGTIARKRVGMLTERVCLIKALRNEGYTCQAIADEFGVTRQAISAAARMTHKRTYRPRLCAACPCGMYTAQYAKVIGHRCKP